MSPQQQLHLYLSLKEDLNLRLYLKGLHFPRISYVGPSTEINQRAASVGRGLVCLNFLLDDSLLEWIVGEEVEQLFFRQNASFEWLLLFEYGFDHIFDGFEVVAGNLSAAEGFED